MKGYQKNKMQSMGPFLKISTHAGYFYRKSSAKKDSTFLLDLGTNTFFLFIMKL